MQLFCILSALLFTSSLSLTAPFSSFYFAENGLCASPKQFVARDDRVFSLQNVAGDGDCMFLAVVLATMSSMGLSWQWNEDEMMQRIARDTRQLVAQVLASTGSNLVIEQNRTVATQALLKSAAMKEGVSTQQYIEMVRRIGREGGLYGGGPELTVLSNVIRRPISIYEIDDSVGSCYEAETLPIRCVGTFGKEFFNDPLQGVVGSVARPFSWNLHILVMDVSEQQKHACILIPKS